MITKAPEAPRAGRPVKAKKRLEEPKITVSDEVMRTFGEEYELTPKMTRSAYADFLRNMEEDYGYVLKNEELLRQTARSADNFKRVVQATGAGSGATKKAEKELSGKIDKAVDAIGEESGKTLSKQERLATKMLVTVAMTQTPQAQEQPARVSNPRGEDQAMSRARRQFEQPDAPAHGEHEEVDRGGDAMPPTLPPRGQQPRPTTGRRGSRPVRG